MSHLQQLNWWSMRMSEIASTIGQCDCVSHSCIYGFLHSAFNIYAIRTHTLCMSRCFLLLVNELLLSARFHPFAPSVSHFLQSFNESTVTYDLIDFPVFFLFLFSFFSRSLSMFCYLRLDNKYIKRYILSGRCFCVPHSVEGFSFFFCFCCKCFCLYSFFFAFISHYVSISIVFLLIQRMPVFFPSLLNSHLASVAIPLSYSRLIRFCCWISHAHSFEKTTTVYGISA